MEAERKKPKKDFDSVIEFEKIFARKKELPGWKKEIYQYNNSPDADVDENILTRWKKNCHLYPNLARLARDVVATPASLLSTERFFQQEA